METISIAGAEIYYDKNFLATEEATNLSEFLRVFQHPLEPITGA
jgi:hypothetical protein